MQAVLASRGDFGINLVRDYCRRIDEYVATYDGAGYSHEQLKQIHAIAERAKAKARADRRVYAYLGV
jgi:hypothetical protein